MCYISFSFGQDSLGLGLLNERQFTFQEANYPEREHLVDVYQSELFYFPLIAGKLTGKVKNLFWHLEEHQGCFWFFGNPEQYPEFEDWIFLVNNCGRRNQECDSSSVYTSLLINSQCHNPKEKEEVSLSNIEIVPFSFLCSIFPFQ